MSERWLTDSLVLRLLDNNNNQTQAQEDDSVFRPPDTDGESIVIMGIWLCVVISPILYRIAICLTGTGQPNELISPSDGNTFVENGEDDTLASVSVEEPEDPDNNSNDGEERF